MAICMACALAGGSGSAAGVPPIFTPIAPYVTALGVTGGGLFVVVVVVVVGLVVAVELLEFPEPEAEPALVDVPDDVVDDVDVVGGGLAAVVPPPAEALTSAWQPTTKPRHVTKSGVVVRIVHL